MPKQIWTISLVQNRFQLVECKTQSFQVGWQQRNPTGTKSYNGRGRLQPVFAVEESLVIAEENFAREENLSPVLIPTLSKDMGEQLWLVNRIVDGNERTIRKISVILLRDSVDKPESSYAQVQLLARKTEDEKIQQSVQLIFTLEEVIHLLDEINSVIDNVIAKKPFCNFLWKVNALIYSLSFSFYSCQDELEH